MQKNFFNKIVLISLSLTSLSLSGSEVNDKQIMQLKNSMQSIHSDFNDIRNNLDTHQHILDNKDIFDDEAKVILVNKVEDLKTKITQTTQDALKTITDRNEAAQIQMTQSRASLETSPERLALQEDFNETLNTIKDLKNKLQQIDNDTQYKLQQIQLDRQKKEIKICEEEAAQEITAEIAKKEATEQFNKKVQEYIDRINKSNVEMAERIQKWNDEHPEKKPINIMPDQQKSNFIFTLLKNLTTKKNLYYAATCICIGTLLLLLYNYTFFLSYQNYFL